MAQVGAFQELRMPREISFQMRMEWKFKLPPQDLVPLDLYDNIEMVFQKDKKTEAQLTISSNDSDEAIHIDSEGWINFLVDRDHYPQLTDTGIYRITLYSGETGIRLLYGTYQLV